MPHLFFKGVCGYEVRHTLFFRLVLLPVDVFAPEIVLWALVGLNRSGIGWRSIFYAAENGSLEVLSLFYQLTDAL
jgi:hypothetical protein